MPSHYQVTEPHPTVSSYARTGRGGAGNTFKAPKTSNGMTAKGPASLFEHGLPSSNSKFSSGRGGAGNIHAPNERAIFSFDEELERQATRDQKMKSWSTGRGGVGNWAHEVQRPAASGRKDSSSSGDSNGSVRPGFFGRLSSTFGDRH